MNGCNLWRECRLMMMIKKMISRRKISSRIFGEFRGEILADFIRDEKRSFFGKMCLLEKMSLINEISIGRFSVFAPEALLVEESHSSTSSFGGSSFEAVVEWGRISALLEEDDDVASVDEIELSVSRFDGDRWLRMNG